MGFDQVCAHPTLVVDSITLFSNNPNSIISKRQQQDSYPESKDFNNWLQALVDPMKAELIRQQFNDFNNFAIFVKERKKVKTVSFK